MQQDTWKYCYWLDKNNFDSFLQEMKAQGLEIRRAEKNPCEALLDDIGYAEPECWTYICNFDALPWYQDSPFKDKTLVVSSKKLDEKYADCLETTITPVQFKPEKMPDRKEREALVNDQGFLKRKPTNWDNFPREMGEQITQGLARMSGKPAGTWDDLFQDWTSVHANFVVPRFRTDDESAIPYSIGDSFSISSCCVELFNLLNSEEAAFLVRPCTGAAMLQVLERDQYYLVRLARNTPQA